MTPSDDEDRRTWSLFTTATEPSADELLTLPPHCSYWLEAELSKQLRELEKDVAALLVDQSQEMAHHDDVIEITSLPRDQWFGYFTPLYEAASKAGRQVTTWSRDDFDLFTWEVKMRSTNLKRIHPHTYGFPFHGDLPGWRETMSNIGEDGLTMLPSWHIFN